MQTIWEIYCAAMVTGIFWCVAHPVTTLATCFAGTALAIWRA